MKMNDQPQSRAVTKRVLHGAGVAAVSIAMSVGTASAQMTPTQPAPAPGAPVAQTVSQYDATFKRVDADGDGFISKAELEKADAKLSADFAKYDTDGDGRLSPAEFDAMMKAIKS